MSLELRCSRSREIQRLLFSSAIFQDAKEIFCYVSFGDEADTRFIIEESLRCGKKTAVPKVLSAGVMEFYYIDSPEQLVPGAFGILEPPDAGNVPAVPGKDTLMLLPGAAFDPHGNRIGYGGGFYDSYLSRFPLCRRAALCFPEQLVPLIPAEDHDIPAEIIITGKEIIKCLPDCPKIR